ncbi:MAG: sulfite exporter TauE/SafE family protein [Capnocytophaga sp.]|nr:sulfite exporter TauE/SafE family protein [Capnocytophaga sp.]
MTDFLILFVAAISAGMLGALTGLGGGVIIVPLLTIGFGVPIHYAVGASLICIIGTSTGAASAYVKEGFTNMRVGIFLEVSTTLGAIAGAMLAGLLPGSILGIIFGLILLVTVVINTRTKPNHKTQRTEGSLADKLKLYGSYPDRGEEVSYAASNVMGGFGMMGVAGMLSGLLGIGGGAFKVLAMDNIMKLPFKVSTTTSNFMIGVTAATSSLIYFQRGHIIPELAAPVLLGVVIGSFAGTKIFMKAKTQSLKVLFAVVVSAVSIYMIYNGITNYLK